MSIEQEDGEVIEGIGMQEFRLISNSARNDSNQEVSSQSNEDKWRKLIMEPFYKVAREAYLELKQREERMNHRIPQMPSLPILPRGEPNNYDWKVWSSWYQNLSTNEKRNEKEDEQRIFSFLITRSPDSSSVFASLVSPDSRIVFESCVDWPQSFYSILPSLPILEGVKYSTISRMTFDELRLQLANALSSLPSRLLVYSLPKDVLSALELTGISTLSVRDLNRFPLSTSTYHIPRVVHNLFVTPFTPLTLSNPLAALMQYLNQLHFSIEWLDIPIPSQSTIKWIRYTIMYERILVLTGYCIVNKNDNTRQRAAFAVLRRLWGVQSPLLYQGVPSREEMMILDQFIQCVRGAIQFSLGQTTRLLIHLYRYYSNEFEYSLLKMAPEKKPEVPEQIPQVHQEISMPVPTPPQLTSVDLDLKRSSPVMTVTESEKPVISLPDLTLTLSPVDENAKLILIVDIDLTIVHAIHDDESIDRFKLWLNEESSSSDENDWKKALRLQLEEIELSYIDDNGNSRLSKLLLKVRPGVREFLSTLAQQYELIIYTQGEDQYAQQVISLLDPKGVYFKNRYIARCDSNELQKKGLTRILDCWNTNMKEHLEMAQLCSRLLIIDDKDDVWESSLHEKSIVDPLDCIVKCFPYVFFNTKTDAYNYQHLKPFEVIEKEYMHRLKEIFTELASQYYSNPADIRSLLRKQKRQVLKGLRVAFTSIIERTEVLENNILYKSLLEFGGVYVDSLEKDCNLLVCRNLRTAKVNMAQQNHIPVVSVRWLEECVKYWKLTSLDPYYMDFAQDMNQTAIMGKSAIIVYHQKAKNLADVTLFTVTEPPPAYTALLPNKEKQVALKDFDDRLLNEMDEASFEEKRSKLSENGKRQYSPSVNVVLDVPQYSTH